MDNKKIILNFLKNQPLAVISTVDGNKPESAVLEFGQNDNLELIFDTFTSSRKYKNLQNNKQVSFVIGWDENITVQYEGLAEELTGKDIKLYQELYWEKNKDAKRWEKREGITYFKVVPTWIRYSNLNKDPWDVFEITF